MIQQQFLISRVRARGFTALIAVKMPQAGSTLKLRLLLAGNPLASQMVENNSNEQGLKTNANGYVRVKVANGINRLTTDHNINQPTDADARRLSMTAALVSVAE